MLCQTDTNMTRVCASKSNRRHFDVACCLPLGRDFLRATVCGGHDGIGEGWWFTFLLWMLRPTNTAVARLRASRLCYTQEFFSVWSSVHVHGVHQYDVSMITLVRDSASLNRFG